MPVGRCSSKLSGHELQTKSKKSQALSEAPRGSIPYRTAYGAESKDPDAAYLTHAARSFSTTEAREQDLAAVRT